VSDTPADRRYTRDHEWVKVAEDGSVTVGITRFAADALGDIVYVDYSADALAKRFIARGGVIAVVESTKSLSDVYSPVTGVVSVVNLELEDEPGQVNDDPYAAWLVTIEDVSGEDVDHAESMSAEEYDAHVGGASGQ
jgi:glycine cleavage system H protein